MDEDKKLSYFFLGVGIGVAVGLLFAPKSGEETRELIRSKAGGGKDYFCMAIDRGWVVLSGRITHQVLSTGKIQDTGVSPIALS